MPSSVPNPKAEAYVRSIPDDNPPFLLVVDVGYSIETYADFSGLGKTYTPFPDNLSTASNSPIPLPLRVDHWLHE